MNSIFEDKDNSQTVSSFQYTQWALRTRLDGSSKLVLAILCDAKNWGATVGTAKLSLNDLRQRTGYGRQKLTNCLSVLKMGQPPLISAKGCGGYSKAMVYSFPLFDELAALDKWGVDTKETVAKTLKAAVSNWNTPKSIQKAKAEAHPERKHKPKSPDKIVMMKWGKEK